MEGSYFSASAVGQQEVPLPQDGKWAERSSHSPQHNIIFFQGMRSK